MSSFSIIMLSTLVVMIIVLTYQQLSIFFPNLKSQIRYVKECNKPIYNFYMDVIQYLKDGNALPIYSNPYFVMTGVAEKYERDKMTGYYALVFHDGDVAIYHNHDRIMLVYYKYLIADVLFRAGITQEDVAQCIEQARVFEKEGSKVFLEKYIRANNV